MYISETGHERKGKAMRIAVPYYGNLVRPGYGLERIYFLADVNLATGHPTSVCMQVWNLRECHELSRWLRLHGIAGVLCSDENPCLADDFQAAGISIWQQERGELPEMIARWTRGRAA